MASDGPTRPSDAALVEAWLGLGGPAHGAAMRVIYRELAGLAVSVADAAYRDDCVQDVAAAVHRKATRRGPAPWPEKGTDIEVGARRVRGYLRTALTRKSGRLGKAASARRAREVSLPDGVEGTTPRSDPELRRALDVLPELVVAVAEQAAAGRRKDGAETVRQGAAEMLKIVTGGATMVTLIAAELRGGEDPMRARGRVYARHTRTRRACLDVIAALEGAEGIAHSGDGSQPLSASDVAVLRAFFDATQSAASPTVRGEFERDSIRSEDPGEL